MRSQSGGSHAILLTMQVESFGDRLAGTVFMKLNNREWLAFLSLNDLAR